MKAVLKDGSEIECDWFKECKNGVLLREDHKKGDLAGFVPYDELRTVAPDGYEAKDRSKITRRSSGSTESNDSGTF